jgi:hypothetical protein
MSKRALKVYFVQIDTNGYMPDSVSAYPTLDQAREAAKEEKRFDLDSFYPDCRVIGDIRKFSKYEVLINGRYHHSIRIESESTSIMDFMPA